VNYRAIIVAYCVETIIFLMKAFDSKDMHISLRICLNQNKTIPETEEHRMAQFHFDQLLSEGVKF